MKSNPTTKFAQTRSVNTRQRRKSMHSELKYFFFNDTPTTEIYTLSLHDALPIFPDRGRYSPYQIPVPGGAHRRRGRERSEEHTSQPQSHLKLVCRQLLEKKK